MANDTLTIRVLRFLPKNLISRGFGWIARLERPRFFVRPFMRWFANRFQIDFEEAAKRFEDYPSLLAMFTRELKEGVRPINQDRGVLVNPVDGRVGAYGRIERGRLVQAKGMDYSLEALLGSAEAAEPFAGGRFATIYLSPRDYHRLHSPDDAKIERTLYEPGKLWPVNAAAVKNVPSLFAVNERVTAFLATERAPLAFVMVGATNVGKIRLAYEDFVSNCGGQRELFEHSPAVPVARGEHLATFELGSTVIVIVGSDSFEWGDLKTGEWIPLGSALGRYQD
ncbi:MAG: archaetidylserine decarboxylase [Planctomycetota bacterium]